jgi:hydroxymethylpyrimidine pyrophosphatase-like HAD family hydrolase
MNAKIHHVRRFRDAPDMPAPLRVNAVVGPQEAPRLAAAMRERFGTRLNIHSILAPNYGVMIVEAFAAAADKWAGVRYVAQANRIGRGGIIAVGDDVNDIAMLREAALGVTLPHAPPEVQAVAKHVAQGGVGEFVRELLDGRFD